MQLDIIYNKDCLEGLKKLPDESIDLISEGYKIIRFSGREIYRNPEKCVDEIINYMTKRDRVS